MLVVGGGSGIGFAVAEMAQANGAQVTIASTNADRVTAAAERLGVGVSTASLDITNEDAVAAYFAASAGFDHIVTTAGDWGGARRGRLADADLAASAANFGVRFWGAVKVAKHGGRVIRPGGSLTLTDGMVAHRPSKGSALATAMAGGIEHLTRGLAVELAPIRVNCVCPGLIATDVWDAMMGDKREAQFAQMTDATCCRGPARGRGG